MNRLLHLLLVVPVLTFLGGAVAPAHASSIDVSGGPVTVLRSSGVTASYAGRSLQTLDDGSVRQVEATIVAGSHLALNEGGFVDDAAWAGTLVTTWDPFGNVVEMVQTMSPVTPLATFETDSRLNLTAAAGVLPYTVTVWSTTGNQQYSGEASISIEFYGVGAMDRWHSAARGLFDDYFWVGAGTGLYRQSVAEGSLFGVQLPQEEVSSSDVVLARNLYMELHQRGPASTQAAAL